MTDVEKMTDKELADAMKAMLAEKHRRDMQYKRDRTDSLIKWFKSVPHFCTVDYDESSATAHGLVVTVEPHDTYGYSDITAWFAEQREKADEEK